jgi:hypothetical protein
MTKSEFPVSTKFIVLTLVLGALVPNLLGCAQREVPAGYVTVQQGNLADHGGTPTIRRSFEQQLDDPSTSNDESNDQPVGHFGSDALVVSSLESGNTYTLDVELDGLEVERIYFPKGGWVDFLGGCELDEDFTGECLDETSRTWTFEGLSEQEKYVEDIEGEEQVQGNSEDKSLLAKDEESEDGPE